MTARPTLTELNSTEYWGHILSALPERSRTTVDTLRAQATAYVWGRQDAGEGDRDTGISHEFADVYGRHAAAFTLELVGFRRNIQDAYDRWRSGGDLNILR
jgi:hypothetical protein